MTTVGQDHAGGHTARARAGRRPLWTALSLLTAFLVVEVVVAFVADSLVLLSDAGHMLIDVGAIAGALWAIRLAAQPARGKWTFGLERAEIVSAALNGITLLVVSGVVTIEAVRRLAHPPATDGGPVLAVALAGIAVNLVATWVLGRADLSSLNLQGAYRHVLTDLYGFLGTGIAAVVILLTGFTRADAIASLFVVGLMVHAAWGLLRDSGRILLEAAPEATDLDEIRQHLLTEPHVHDVHDLHLWTVTSGLPALSAHVVVDDSCFTDGHAPRLLDGLQAAWSGTSTSSTPPSSWSRADTQGTSTALTPELDRRLSTRSTGVPSQKPCR